MIAQTVSEPLQSILDITAMGECARKDGKHTAMCIPRRHQEHSPVVRQLYSNLFLGRAGAELPTRRSVKERGRKVKETTCIQGFF